VLECLFFVASGSTTSTFRLMSVSQRWPPTSVFDSANRIAITVIDKVKVDKHELLNQAKILQDDLAQLKHAMELKDTVIEHLKVDKKEFDVLLATIVMLLVLLLAAMTSALWKPQQVVHQAHDHASTIVLNEDVAAADTDHTPRAAEVQLPARRSMRRGGRSRGHGGRRDQSAPDASAPTQDATAAAPHDHVLSAKQMPVQYGFIGWSTGALPRRDAASEPGDRPVSLNSIDSEGFFLAGM